MNGLVEKDAVWNTLRCVYYHSSLSKPTEILSATKFHCQLVAWRVYCSLLGHFNRKSVPEDSTLGRLNAELKKNKLSRF